MADIAAQQRRLPERAFVTFFWQNSGLLGGGA
jgi:hypothetical protein